MGCPDGLINGTGLTAELARSICVTRSFFGHDDQGLAVYAAGTGFLVNTTRASSLILTAAHNVYSPHLRRKAIWTSLYFGRAGDTSDASRDMKSMLYPDEFDDSGDAPEAWDFAIIRVCPLDPARFEPFPLRLSTADGETAKLLVGYPTGGACTGRFRPYHAPIMVSPSSPHNYSYRPIETYPGMSGGPLLTTSAPYGVFGTHIRGGDAHRAVRFSQPVMDRIARWIRDLSNVSAGCRG